MTDAKLPPRGSRVGAGRTDGIYTKNDQRVHCRVQQSERCEKTVLKSGRKSLKKGETCMGKKEVRCTSQRKGLSIQKEGRGVGKIRGGNALSLLKEKKGRTSWELGHVNK